MEKDKNNSNKKYLLIITFVITGIFISIFILVTAFTFITFKKKANRAKLNTEKFKAFEEFRSSISDFYVLYGNETSICIENDIKQITFVKRGDLCNSKINKKFNWSKNQIFKEENICIESKKDELIFTHDSKSRILNLCLTTEETKQFPY